MHVCIFFHALIRTRCMDASQHGEPPKYGPDPLQELSIF